MEELREEREETYTHTPPVTMNNAVQRTNLEAPAPGAKGSAPTTELLEGCITSLEELKKRFTVTYVGMVRQNKDEHSLMTTRQKQNEAISSFQDRFQTEFNLVPRLTRR
ncbi:hypothetical protein LIER_14142 [Lithospermum erythrorhizon]|uniref:Gag protein n=1 Tax=Lithospermum erythrorhizon TaxID=34254 RepID=A0AAV3Q3A3_LITER